MLNLLLLSSFVFNPYNFESNYKANSNDSLVVTESSSDYVTWPTDFLMEIILGYEIEQERLMYEISRLEKLLDKQYLSQQSFE